MPALTAAESRKDIHSHANPDQVRVRHADLDLRVDFTARTLAGTATLTLEQAGEEPADTLVLDSRDLAIEAVETSPDGAAFAPADFALGARDPILGSAVEVTLPPGTTQVRLRYTTSPGASALQWLTPAQTAGKRHPFLFTQSQAIHARSWIPLQDSPGVRISYSARIRTPRELMAVMSAAGNPQRLGQGEYRFEMRQPVPSYLIALAVGDLAFAPLGSRTGVYAEPPVIRSAAREFEDTEKMMAAVEALYGPYRWGRYDLLVLPPSFPFGGMENPRLTFATPTILAGDKSLVSLVAHELAHSWSGNLVTNATWRDFWLNEGFTVYLENRIQEQVYGKERADMDAVLEVRDLKRELATLPPGDQHLAIDLAGRDPDDAVTSVPYVKGAMLLRTIESLVGRERFDAFLRAYFDGFAFQSITTHDFVRYLKANLLDKEPEVAARLPLDRWLYEPGLPPGAAEPSSDALGAVEQAATGWASGERSVRQVPFDKWSTQERLHFLHSLPATLNAEQMAAFDRAYRLTQTGNAEILQVWLLRAVRAGYQPAYPRLEQFLTSVGRRKYLKPLYEELMKTEKGRDLARSIYAKARRTYHPIAVNTIDAILEGRAQ